MGQEESKNIPPPGGFGTSDPFKNNGPQASILAPKTSLREAIARTDLIKVQSGHTFYDPTLWDIYERPYPGNVVNHKYGPCLIHGVRMFRDQFGKTLHYYLITVVRPLQDPPISSEQFICPQYVSDPRTGAQYHFLEFVPCIIFKLTYNSADPLNSEVVIRTFEANTVTTLGEVNKQIYPPSPSAEKSFIPNLDLKRACSMFMTSNFQFKMSNDIFIKYLPFKQSEDETSQIEELPVQQQPVSSELNPEKVVHISAEKLYKKNEKLFKMVEANTSK